MADQTSTVRESIEDDSNEDLPSFGMPNGGGFVLDAICKVGSITLTLMTRLQDTGSWVVARDEFGNLLTKSLTTSDAHWHVEFLAHGGQEFFLDPSSSSSDVDCDVAYGRVGN